MTIPEFETDGFLPEGVWSTSQAEFMLRFCASTRRQNFGQSLEYIFEFASRRGATRIIFGGSFVARTDLPNDVDCSIIFKEANQIPSKIDRLVIADIRLDLLFCSEDQPALLGGIVALLRKNRRGRDVGVVEVTLATKAVSLTDIIQYPNSPLLELLRSSYKNRHVVDIKPSTRALITVHGIRSHGEWSAEVCHIASANGWIVAPFSYGFQSPRLFMSSVKRAEIVDKFRKHIFDIRDRYKADISVIAHSFGTYIVAKYLLGFDGPPVRIDTLIMTGSVLNANLEVNRFDRKVSRLINEVAPNDAWVGFPTMFQFSDELFGNSGKFGFKQDHALLEQRSCQVFNHNNVIRRDVVVERWMPRLEAYVGRWRVVE